MWRRQPTPACLDELAHLGSDLNRENELRDEIARLAKSPRLRPVSYYGNTRGFYLFLWDDTRDRYYIWLNLHPENSRFAQPRRDPRPRRHAHR
jgi:hypothetical protein